MCRDGLVQPTCRSSRRALSCFCSEPVQSVPMSCPSPRQAGTHVSITANLINRLCVSKEFLPTSFYVCREVLTGKYRRVLIKVIDTHRALSAHFTLISCPSFPDYVAKLIKLYQTTQPIDLYINIVRSHRGWIIDISSILYIYDPTSVGSRTV